MRKSVAAVLGIAAMAAVVSTAYAATEIPGFIGKGDVQSAFGWNNGALQSNADGVGFRALEQQVRRMDCREQGNPHSNPIILVDARTQERTIRTTVAYDSRNNKKGQITGFLLEDIGNSNPGGGGGVDTTTCPTGYTAVGGGWGDWESMGLTLYVTHGGRTVALF
jgi:hypothetical protein